MYICVCVYPNYQEKLHFVEDMHFTSLKGINQKVTQKPFIRPVKYKFNEGFTLLWQFIQNNKEIKILQL